MINWNLLKSLIYKYPEATDKEIAEKLVEKQPELLDEYKLDSIRRKIATIREIPPDFSSLPKDLLVVAIEKYLLDRKIAKKKAMEELFKITPSMLEDTIDELRVLGYNIMEDEMTVELKPLVREVSPVIMSNYEGKMFRFGAIGDTHLCSIYERLDILYTLYDIFEKEGITTVFHAGNWIDGESKKNYSELFVHGLEAQVDYFVRNYPYKPSIKTFFISGDDHEGWWTQNIGFRDIGKYAVQRRKELGKDDLVYLGYLERDILIKHPETGKTASIRLAHPGGGSAYAISYTPQKIIESYINDKPNVLLLGHFHKALQGFYRNVYYVLVGTTQDQTTFMRKKKLQAALGGWIVEVGQAPDGAVNKFRAQFFPFFDKKYYIIKKYYSNPEAEELHRKPVEVEY